MNTHFLIHKSGQLLCGLYVPALDISSGFTKKKEKVTCCKCIRLMIYNSKNKRIRLKGAVYSIE